MIGAIFTLVRRKCLRLHVCAWEEEDLFDLLEKSKYRLERIVDLEDHP